MAITTYRQRAVAGWASTTPIYQLEAGFAQLGWHAGSVSGIVTGIDNYSGQSVVGTSGTTFWDARPKSGGTNIGVGDTCSFSVYRSNGSVYQVYVNRGGHGYADGDNLVIDGDAIGGGSDMTVVVQTDETTYGSTSTFYDKDVTNGSTNPWGVLRMEQDNTKVFGDVYWGFQVNNNDLYITSGTSFMPYDNNTFGNKGHNYANSFRGVEDFELSYEPGSAYHNYTNSTYQTQNDQTFFEFASSDTYALELNIFRSGIDTDFAIFSFRQPDLPASSIDGNTFGAFFLHKFNHSLFDFDHMCLMSMTYMDPDYRYMNQAYFEMNTTFGGGPSNVGNYMARSALAGWQTGNNANSCDKEVRDKIFGNTYPSEITANERRHYYRNNDRTVSFRGDPHFSDYTQKMPDSLNFNAVIKGIPLTSQFVPCPFYLPDDFVLIQFDNAQPGQNIQQFDTVTISGSEVYTVINGAYNQTTRTRGILLCARTT